MARAGRITCLTALVLITAGPLAAAEDSATSEQPSLAARTMFFQAYCADCHTGSAAEAGLDVEQLSSSPIEEQNLSEWVKVLEMLQERVMPPAEMPQPEQAEIDGIVQWLDSQLTSVSRQLQRPGRVTLRRLNRAEYNNTIRDLVGIDFRPADDFPADDVGHGFDNIGDVLSLPPLLTEKYFEAADQIVEKLFADPEALAQVVTCRPNEKRSPEDCLRTILSEFAGRAFRRPVEEGELRRLLELAEQAREHGADFDEQVQWTLQAILMSPHFLFRIEQEPAEADGIRRLNDYELATRLSYFLWSSMPDEQLFKLASDGKLRKDQVLEQQVERMLKDPKADALVKNFAGQWLQLRNLAGLSPDPQLFPQFDEQLREAMLEETERFFASVMREDRSILEFLDGDFSFLNERLARHYGIEGVEGSQFQRVALPPQRRGVLTQASILTLTSNPTRTSPVKRGKWILENMLGTPPPPPPPGAGELEEGDVELLGSLRERTEQHRADPNCATCHQRMDPLGFGLENFNAVGAWREQEGQFPIDASGMLPSGQSFDGPAELMQVLKQSRREDFCRCLTEKMLTYALGRGLEVYDRGVVEDVLEHLDEHDHRFSSLITAIVTSDPFRKVER